MHNTSLYVKLAANLFEVQHGLAIETDGPEYCAALKAHEGAVRAVAKAIGAENPYFDESRFIRACGVHACEGEQ